MTEAVARLRSIFENGCKESISHEDIKEGKLEEEEEDEGPAVSGFMWFSKGKKKRFIVFSL